MAGFLQYKCVRYFKVPSNKSDINFWDSRETVRKELDDLSFSISPTNSICKACLCDAKFLICEISDYCRTAHAQTMRMNDFGS
jgi:hypothetical protein